MGDSRYANCRRCGRTRDEAGELSWTRLCSDCSSPAQEDWNLSLHRHKGPAFETWRRKMAASVGAVLVDDLQPTE